MPRPLLRTLYVWFVSLLCMAFATSAQAAPAELVVKLDGASARSKAMQRSAASDLALQSGATVIRRIPQLGIVVMQPHTAASRGELLADDRVKTVAGNGRLQALELPTLDPDFTLQWMHQAIGSEPVWASGRTGVGITVAVIDTGIDFSHPDLAARLVPGIDVLDRDDDPTDETQGHGTHVASIIAADDNELGMMGVAPDAQIMPIRVLGSDGGSFTDVAQGVVWAVDHGAQIINLSLGAPDREQVLEDALVYAADRGVVSVCAAGNDGAADLNYPASSKYCLSVGASTEDGQLAPFSNAGAQLDLVAPGTGIYGAVLGGSYAAWDGTSMATPVVAGSMAALMSGGLNGRSARAALMATAWDRGAPGTDAAFGAGIVDLAAASGLRPRKTASDNRIGRVLQSTQFLPTTLQARRSCGTYLRRSCRWKLGDKTGMFAQVQGGASSLQMAPAKLVLQRFVVHRGWVTYPGVMTSVAEDDEGLFTSAIVRLHVGQWRLRLQVVDHPGTHGLYMGPWSYALVR